MERVGWKGWKNLWSIFKVTDLRRWNFGFKNSAPLGMWMKCWSIGTGTFIAWPLILGASKGMQRWDVPRLLGPTVLGYVKSFFWWGLILKSHNMHVFGDMVFCFFFACFARGIWKEIEPPQKCQGAEGTGGISIDVSCKIVTFKMVTT